MKRNIWLIVLVVLIAAAPLVLFRDAEFGGSDDRATEAVRELDPNYKPWFQSLWQPPSSEVESFLFALQAGIGAGFIGYFFGYHQGRRAAQHAEKRNEDRS